MAPVSESAATATASDRISQIAVTGLREWVHEMDGWTTWRWRLGKEEEEECGIQAAGWEGRRLVVWEINPTHQDDMAVWVRRSWRDRARDGRAGRSLRDNAHKEELGVWFDIFEPIKNRQIHDRPCSQTENRNPPLRDTSTH
jgi:hypothetical protein